MKRMLITAILLATFGSNSKEGFTQSASATGSVAYYSFIGNANDESSNGRNVGANLNENGVTGWHALNSGTTEGIAAVHFPNEQIGYAVGNNGIILKTTDAGISWNSLSSPTGDHFWDVYFVSSDTGCAVGGISHASFMIYKTTNGGGNWEQKLSGTGNTLTDVYFVDANIGYAVGGGSAGDSVRSIMILKTTDGGNTWTPRNFNTTEFRDLFLSMVCFLDAATGYAVGHEYQGGKSIILKTTNGGEEWSSEIRDEYALAGVYFTDFNTGYIVGEYGIILKTTDAGSHWNPQSSGTQEHLYSVCFTDANTGYAVGGSSYTNAIILETPNGGINWNSSYSATGYQLEDVFFTDANTGYASGSSGTILKTSMLPAPVLLSPADGATGISAHPNLRWNAVTEAISYKLQVAADSAFSTLVVDQDDLTFTAYDGSRLVNNTAYYWRVKAVSASDESAWSSARRFTTRRAPIYANVNTPQMAGSEFWVSVKIGDKADSVANLFGLSLVLNFTPTDYIDVVTPVASNVLAGGFMGSDLVFQQKVDEAAGKVSVGISRKSGQGGVGGRGVALRVKFVASADTPHGAQVTFSISEVTAIDDSGASILLKPRTGTLTINYANVMVWPGDANNDGTVNQADVLPVGLYWGRTGPARQNASMSWLAQVCQPWTPLAAAYADANGDGVVNQTDVLPIGFNWSKTHTDSSTLAAALEMEEVGELEGVMIEPIVNPATPAPDQEIVVQVQMYSVNGLFGLAFELVCDQPEMLQILSAVADSSWGADVVFYANVNTDAGKAAVGVSRKAGQEGMNGDLSVVRVKARISSQAANGSAINLSLQNVVANDSHGNPIDLNLRSVQTVIGETTNVDGDEGVSLPRAFRLHQNQPNPLRASAFNGSTVIRYELPIATPVVVKVYNSAGQEVRTLVNKFQQAGSYRADWNGRDENGRPLRSGLYLYRLQAGSYAQSYKMLLLR